MQPAKKGFGGGTMLFNGKVIGKSGQPLYDAARWLLAIMASINWSLNLLRPAYAG